MIKLTLVCLTIISIIVGAITHSHWLTFLSPKQIRSSKLNVKSVSQPHSQHIDHGSLTKSPIQHIVVICQENHSFDNYFGTYPNATGFNPLPGTPHVDNIPPGMFNLNRAGKKIRPFTFSDKQVKTLDIDHGYHDMIRSYNHGLMNQFVIVSQHHNAHVGNLAMGHYNYKTIPAYWDYAQHFALADHWFQPIFGPTTPNVLYLVAAQSGTKAHPIIKTTPPTKYRLKYANIGDRLTQKHVSWAWYQGGRAKGVDYKDDPFRYFLNYDKGAYRGHIRDLKQFAKDLTAHRLPSVCFIKANGEDEHPGTNILRGPRFVTKAVNEIMRSSYWKHTAIVLTYDESGGFWDHVSPPQVQPGPDGLRGDGPRIPTLVISPYAKNNYVSHVVYNTTSILHFIEWNWGLPALNNRDAKANNMLDFFQFTKPDFRRFFIGSYQAPAAPGTSPVHVKINNFPYGSTGTYAPFLKNSKLYMSINDLTRNLNIHLHQNKNGFSFSWKKYSIFVPKQGQIVRINGKAFKLGANMWISNRKKLFIPLNKLATALDFRIKWNDRQNVVNLFVPK